jgi:ABC-type dipeptide/oligopeptide/nickel transport system ATPase component
MTALQINGLFVDFNAGDEEAPAIENMSLAVQPGEILALVGESGSGKSTMCLAVMGLLPSAARIGGEIIVGGTRLSGLSRREMEDMRGAQMGLIFQEPMTALNPVLTIRRQITEGPRRHLGINRKDAEQLAHDALNTVGIVEPLAVMGLYPHQLSGGMRQRVLIAAALTLKPALLIADEPTSALDVITQAQILELLVALKQRNDSGILLVTHNMGVVAEAADRVAVMRKGQIVEAGSVPQILYAPRHEYTKKLLAAQLTIDRALALRAGDRGDPT